MSVSPPPLSWPAILVILAVAAVVTGVAVGALGYLIALPQWLPRAALAGVVSMLAVFLIARRNAQTARNERR